MIIKVPIELPLNLKGGGPQAAVKALREVEQQAKVTNKEMDRLHAEALKMDGQWRTSTQRAGAFADTIGQTSKKLALAADSFGLPVGPLRALDDVMDVTSLGMGNLTKASAGFNAASVGVVGAGLAIGAAIGSWLNTFPAVQKAADSLFHGMFRLVGLAGEVNKSATEGLVGGRDPKVAAAHEEALMKQVASMREQGKTAKEIAAFYKGVLNPAQLERLGLTEKAVKAEEQILKANQKQVEEAKKLALERKEFAAKVKRQESDRMIEEMAGLVTMADLVKAAPGKRPGGTAAAMVKEFEGSRLPGETLSGILAEEAETKKRAAEATKLAEEETQQLIGTFGTLSQQLTNLAQVTGGFTGKLLGMLAALSSGAGGITAFKDAGKEKGLLGLLGKASAGLGIVGSAVGLVGGFKGLFGGGKEKREAAEASKILGETVTREQLKALKDEAKAQGKDWRQYLRERKAADDRDRAIAARQRLEQGLGTARGGAEGLMERLAAGGLSEGLSGALSTLIGKVGEALMREGLGVLDGRLKESKEFGAAQGIAGEAGQVIAGMREAGMVDKELLTAGGAAAAELQQQAVAAAEAAGLAPAEATRAGFAAIAPLLREQLNASMASGVELDDNTKQLLEEAKKNGINIVADPMIESVAVQKDMLRELRGMNAKGAGAPDREFATGTRGLRLVKKNMLARIHEGEGLLVVPRDEMGRMSFSSFARGSDRERGGGLGDRRERPGPSGPGAGGGTTSGGGAPSASAVAAVDALAAKVAAAATQIQTTYAPQVTVVDQSLVKTVEGQRSFQRFMADELHQVLRQGHAGLEADIARQVRRELRNAS